jgi:phage protein U
LAKIGSFGDIVFEVSDKKTQTFKDLERSGAARWNDHEIIGHKAKSEFSGPGLEEISFSILLKAELGINPSKQLEKLRKMRDTGKAAPFIQGGKPISQNYWTIQQISESHKTIDNKGSTLTAEVSLDLKEYVVKKKAPPKKTTKTSQKTTTSNKKKTLGKMTITVKSVHIRSGPSVSSKVIGYAFNGDVLTVKSEENGWYSLGQGKYITANSAYSKLEKG